MQNALKLLFFNKIRDVNCYLAKFANWLLLNITWFFWGYESIINIQDKSQRSR